MGKFFQLMGLCILPIALFYSGVYHHNLKAELVGLLIGSIFFLLGWKLEQRRSG